MNNFMIGLSINIKDKEILFLFGYRYFSIYFQTNKKFKIHFTNKSLEQCKFELNTNRKKLKNFFGYIKY